MKFLRQEKSIGWQLWERELDSKSLEALNAIIRTSHIALDKPPVLTAQDIADIWNCKPEAYDKTDNIMPLYRYEGVPKNLVGLVRILVDRWLKQATPTKEFGASEDLQCWTEE